MKRYCLICHKELEDESVTMVSLYDFDTQERRNYFPFCMECSGRSREFPSFKEIESWIEDERLKLKGE